MKGIEKLILLRLVRNPCINNNKNNSKSINIHQCHYSMKKNHLITKTERERERERFNFDLEKEVKKENRRLYMKKYMRNKRQREKELDFIKWNKSLKKKFGIDNKKFIENLQYANAEQYFFDKILLNKETQQLKEEIKLAKQLKNQIYRSTSYKMK